MTEMVVTTLEVDLQKYSRSMEVAARQARQFDTSIQDATDSLKKFQQTAEKTKPIEIELETDTSALDRAESDIKALDGRNVEVEVRADTDAAENRIKSLDDLGNLVEFNVRADTSTAEGQIDALDDGEKEIKVDANTNAAKTDIDALGGREVEAEVKGDTSDIAAQLEDLKRLAVIDLVFNVAGSMQGLSDIPIIGDLLELDTQVSNVEGRLNKTIPGLRDTLTNITGTGLTDTEGAANAIIQVGELANEYGDLETVVTNTLEAAKVRGVEFSQQLDEARRLVDSGLAPSLEKANQALVFLQQTGGNANGDIGGTIEEFSRTFEGAGFSLEQFAVMSGEAQRVGARNVEMMGETFLSLRETLDEALTTKEGDAYQVLVDLELTEEAQQFSNGEISGAEFADSYKKAVNEQLASGLIDPAAANNMTTTLMGSYAVDQGFLDIDWSKVEGATIPDDVINQSIEKFDGGLLPAIDRMGAAIQEQVLDKFGGLDTILNDVTAKINTITELIQGGTALPEALEIALEAPGLAATINQFASSANNLILEFLTGVANILERIGQKGAADSVRGYVSQAAEGQLTYDLKVAPDARAMITALETAERRGVNPQVIEDMTNLAGVELVQEGQLDQAKELVDTLTAIPQSTVTITASIPDDTLTGAHFEDVVLPLDIDENATQEEIDKAVQAAKDAYLQANPENGFRFGDAGTVTFNDLIDVSAAERAVNDATDELYLQFSKAATETNWAEALDIGTQLNNPILIAGAESGMKQALAQVGDGLGNVWDLLMPGGDNPSGQSAGNDPTRLLAETGETASGATKEFDLLEGSTQTLSDALEQRAATALDTTTDKLDKTTAATEDADLKISIFGVTVDTTLGTAAENIEAHGLRIIEGLNNIRDAAKEASTEVGNVKVPSGGGGGSEFETDGNGRALGGATSGWTMVGEQGREMIHAGTGASVLNNRTTEAMLLGMQIGSGMGGSSKTTNINLYVTNNNQGMAARAGAENRMIDRMRGFN